MVEPPSDPRKVADMLEALARRLRDDPQLASLDAASGGAGLSVTSPAALEGRAEDEPLMGEPDVQADDEGVTVTLETRNVDPRAVQVRLLEGRLLIDLGEGAHACRRDLALPWDVDEDRAVATLRNGVLDVVLPLKDRRS